MSIGYSTVTVFVYSLNYVSDGVKVEPIMIFRFFFLAYLVLVSGLWFMGSVVDNVKHFNHTWVSPIDISI